MLNPAATAHAATLEECVDDLDAFIVTLARFDDSIIVAALRMHLSGLLHAMLDTHRCTREEVRQFLLELEREALGVGAD